MHGAKMLVTGLMAALAAFSSNPETADQAPSANTQIRQAELPLSNALNVSARPEADATTPTGRITGVRAIRTANRYQVTPSLPPELLTTPVASFQQPAPQALPPQNYPTPNPPDPNCNHKCCKWVKEPYLEWVCDRKPVDVTVYCCEEICKEPICHAECDPKTGKCIEITGIKRIKDFVPKHQKWMTLCAYQIVKYRDVKKCCDCGCHCE